LQYGLSQCITAIYYIDGEGNDRLAEVGKDTNDEFCAIGVSMGLFGIITKVRFQLVKQFYILGNETTYTESGCIIKFKNDYDKNSTEQYSSLRSFFTLTEDARFMYWPHPGINKVVIWQAKHVSKDEYDKYPDLKPYVEMEIANSQKLGQLLMGLFLFISEFPFLRDSAEFFATIVNLIVEVDSDKGGQKFRDLWWGLSMDNQISDKLVPLYFMELWLPIEQAKEIFEVMQSYFKVKGLAACGHFCNEFYSAKKSPFWLSQGYGRDSLRINFNFFKKAQEENGVDPHEFFKQFFVLMKEKNFSFRVHWGKLANLQDAEYLRGQYEKFNEWIALRNKRDPHKVFVTKYWADMFDIK